MREDIEKMLREEGWTRLANGNWRAPDDSEQASERERRIEAAAEAWRQETDGLYTMHRCRKFITPILDAADEAVPMVSLAAVIDALRPFALLADEVDVLRHSDESTCLHRLMARDLRRARNLIRGDEACEDCDGTGERVLNPDYGDSTMTTQDPWRRTLQSCNDVQLMELANVLVYELSAGGYRNTGDITYDVCLRTLTSLRGSDPLAGRSRRITKNAT